jgi:hypothetical protein
MAVTRLPVCCGNPFSAGSPCYEDVNDAERLRHDPAMRRIVGGKAAKGRAASTSQMGRFETKWLALREPRGTERSLAFLDRLK